MRDDPDRPPPHALPLARALRELAPVLARRQYERLSAKDRAIGDKYFGGPVDNRSALRNALRDGEEARSWGREGSLSGPWVALPAALWPRLWCIDWELGLVSDEIVDNDGESQPATLMFWGVRVALVEDTTTSEGCAPSVGGKRRNAQDDALRKNKVEAVIAIAKTLWPDRGRRPPTTEIVNELTRRRKAQGFAPDTVRKILSGTYEPAKRLGISLDW